MRRIFRQKRNGINLRKLNREIGKIEMESRAEEAVIANLDFALKIEITSLAKRNLGVGKQEIRLQRIRNHDFFNPAHHQFLMR